MFPSEVNIPDIISKKKNIQKNCTVPLYFSWSSIYSDLSSSNVPGPCVPGPCNVTVRLSSSFEEIVNDKDLFKLWAKKSSYPRNRPYNALEALWIYHRLEQWMGGPPEIHPPEGGWFWHFKWNNKHIPISLEAYELLKKLFGE